MMQLNNTYDRDDFLKFLEDNFLTDFKKDIRSANTQSFSSIQKAYSLGRSESLDLQIFEFSFEGSPNKRVTLTKDAFQIMRSSAIFRALAIFHSPDSDDWRLSLMTATPEPTEKGKVALSYSNPKRLSFFLGPNAKVNTPTRFLISKDKVTDYEDLKNRFSIEVVNKEFYKEISQTFTKLVSGLLKLPSTQDKSQINLEFAVRLIGRVIFCWFLREKKSQTGIALMPKELLSLEAVNKHDDYYHNILEPIFFEILNKPVKSRRDDFTKEPFSSVPYLNGGLFSPQDDDYYKRTNDDFQSQYHNTLEIPDSWFKNFFEILETYNFTIDENTSYDEELSIDPEMLGRIFENLLAEINPETGESARKSTGSYYTPRVIVDYMVDESLLLYLKEQTGINEEKLRAIISYDLDDDIENPVTPAEKEKIIDALEKVKILDPACGSGAFPIGALQKIVFILQQTDPDGQLWFKKQIQNTSPEIKRVVEREFSHKNFDYIRKLGIIRENIYGVDIQSIATEISRLRCFLTLIVDESIQDGTENRGIEPLPNLDFKFVTANSLIGLPKTDQPQQSIFDDYQKIDELKQIRDQYFNASGLEREQLKTEFVTKQKRLFIDLQKEFGWAGVTKAELTNKLSDWEPFSHKTTSWFDPDWMFGIKEGFDIVIANPPYVRADNPEFKQQREQIKKTGYYETLYEKWDLFLPFIEKGLKSLSNNGTLCYITSNSLLTSKFAFKLLEYIQKNYFTQFIDFFSDDTKVFEAGVIPVVFGISIKPINSKVRKTSHTEKFENISKKDEIDINEFNNSGKGNFKPSNIIYKIEKAVIPLGDICYISKGMVLNSDENNNKGAFVKNDLISDVKTEINKKPYIEGKYLKKYLIEKIKYLEWDTKRVPDLLSRPTFSELYSMPKIMRGRVTEGIYDNAGLLCNDSILLFLRFCDLDKIKNLSISNSIHKFNSLSREILEEISKKFEYKYLLAIMNSKFSMSYLNTIRRHRLKNYFYPDDFRKLPIVEITLDQQKPFVELVDKILAITKSEDYLTNSKKQAKVKDYEEQIDQLVYKLYGLTNEEIEVVGGKNE